MLSKLKSRFLATSVSVAALTVGMAFAQPAQKASAQVAGAGSTAAANLYNGFGANYNQPGSPTGSGTCSSGTDAGFDFCGTDIPYGAVDGYTITPVANLRIEAPVNGGVVSGLDQGTVCAIFRGDITNFNQVGGPDQPITVVYRLPVSGTGTIINSICGSDGSNVPGAIGVGSTGAVISTVQSTPGAIGYAEQANVNAAEATTAVNSPFTGPTYAIYSNGNTNASDFINTILGNPDLVRSLGYDPLQ